MTTFFHHSIPLTFSKWMTTSFELSEIIGVSIFRLAKFKIHIVLPNSHVESSIFTAAHSSPCSPHRQLVSNPVLTKMLRYTTNLENGLLLLKSNFNVTSFNHNVQIATLCPFWHRNCDIYVLKSLLPCVWQLCTISENWKSTLQEKYILACSSSSFCRASLSTTFRSSSLKSS